MPRHTTFLISSIAFFKKNDYVLYHYTPLRAAAKAYIKKRSFPVFAALTTIQNRSFVITNSRVSVYGAMVMVAIMRDTGRPAAPALPAPAEGRA
jgi:hypothetical protein